MDYKFLKPFLNHFCFVAGRIILLKDATAIKEYNFHESNVELNADSNEAPSLHCHFSVAGGCELTEVQVLLLINENRDNV